MVRVAAASLIWATALFTLGAVGLVGTWALTTAAIAFAAAAVVLAIALDDGPARRPIDDEVAPLPPATQAATSS